MPGVVPSVGLVKLLEDEIPTLISNGFEVHLFQNDYDPVKTSVVGDFTEATFSGYAFASVSSFTAASLDDDENAITFGLPCNFINDTGVVGNQIYGYYVLDGDGVLLCAERDPNAPINMLTAGKQYTVVPTLTFSWPP